LIQKSWIKKSSSSKLGLKEAVSILATEKFQNRGDDAIAEMTKSLKNKNFQKVAERSFDNFDSLELI
jgi:hypothetical protein